MALFKCPQCDALLASQEVTDGWCETCGKKLPARLQPIASDSLPDSGPPPAAGWSGTIVLVLVLLFVAALLVIGIVRDGPIGIWHWFQAMVLFVVFLGLAGVCLQYCQFYPHWTTAYRVMAVICVLAAMGFSVITVLWGPFWRS